MNTKIVFTLIALVLGVTAFSQNFSTDKQLTLNNSVDSLLDQYEKYSCLTKNTTSFSQEYANELIGLFTDRGEAKVPNDLPLSPHNKTIYLTEYIDLIKNEVPSGLDVILKNIVKSDITPVENGYLLEASFEKNMLGIYKDEIRFDQITEIVMTLSLDSKLKNAKIVSVAKLENEEKPKPPKNLTGRTNITAGTGGVFYSVDAAKDADYYTWSTPEEWETEGNLNTVFVNFDTDAKSGNLIVYAHNKKGKSEAATLKINVAGGVPKPNPTGSTKSKWSIAGTGGLGSSSEFGLTISGTGWLSYALKEINNDVTVVAKAGLGLINPGIGSAKYYANMEVPFMIGAKKDYGNFQIGIHTGINLNRNIYSSKAKDKALYASSTKTGWISDIELKYPTQWFNGNVALIGGFRYRYLPNIEFDSETISPSTSNIYGGIILNTSILQELRK